MFVFNLAIKNQPIRNEDPKDAKLHEFKEEIARLRKMLQDRKAMERKKDKPKRLPREKTNSPQLQDNSGKVLFYVFINTLYAVIA